MNSEYPETLRRIEMMLFRCSEVLTFWELGWPASEDISRFRRSNGRPMTMAHFLGRQVVSKARESTFWQIKWPAKEKCNFLGHQITIESERFAF
jgi:hypothetical protein